MQKTWPGPINVRSGRVTTFLDHLPLWFSFRKLGGRHICRLCRLSPVWELADGRHGTVSVFGISSVEMNATEHHPPPVVETEQLINYFSLNSDPVTTGGKPRVYITCCNCATIFWGSVLKRMDFVSVKHQVSSRMFRFEQQSTWQPRGKRCVPFDIFHFFSFVCDISSSVFHHFKPVLCCLHNTPNG